MNHCPVYQTVGGHAYGWVYPGPMGSVLTPVFNGLEKAPDLPQAATLCGACQAACPVKIQIPELLVRNRAAQHDERVTSRGEEFVYRLWSRVLRSPFWYRLATRTAGWWLPRFAKDGWLRRLPGPLKGWTQCRDFPAPARRSFRDQWQDLQQESSR